MGEVVYKPGKPKASPLYQIWDLFHPLDSLDLLKLT